MTNEQKSETLIGVVNIEALVNQSPKVIALKEEQQSKRNDLQSWVNWANAEIEAQTDAAQKADLSKKYQEELNKRQLTINNEYAQKVQAIDNELNTLIANIAKAEKLEYVFNRGAVVFGGKDITQQAIDALKK